MTEEEVGEALALIATSSTPRPLLELWKGQQPAFRVASLKYSKTKPSADPHFWKTVAHAWSDDFLYRAYVRQERKRALLGKSAGNTPYPSAAILFESGDDEDDDIKCGRCENPIAYCHCSPTMLPPRINVDEEEDDEEAEVPSAEGSDKENRPVEVRVGRGMGGEADEGGRVQAHRSRMYAPGTPQRATRRSLSPTPDGFVRNRGQNYIPSESPLPMDEESPRPSGSRFAWGEPRSLGVHV
jgi:hypothetical protein